MAQGCRAGDVMRPSPWEGENREGQAFPVAHQRLPSTWAATRNPLFTPSSWKPKPQ